MRTTLVILAALTLLAFAPAAPVSSAQGCTGVDDVQELCTYPNTYSTCYRLEGVYDSRYLCVA